MIDLKPDQLAIVARILKKYVPDCEVRVFGSRVKGNVKKFSDLDLVIIDDSALSPDLLGRIEDAFEYSDLPIRVDVLDWHGISDGFRKIIDEDCEIIQQGAQGKIG